MAATRKQPASTGRTAASSTATVRCTSPTATIIAFGGWRRKDSTMLRPLWLDLWLTLYPVAIAAAAWFAGRYARRMPGAISRSCLILALLIVPLPLLRFVPGWGDFVDLHLHMFGGTTRLECGAALFLLGIAWAAPRKSLSPAFLGIVAGLVGLIFLTEMPAGSGGASRPRRCGPTRRTRTAASSRRAASPVRLPPRRCCCITSASRPRKARWRTCRTHR